MKNDDGRPISAGQRKNRVSLQNSQSKKLQYASARKRKCERVSQKRQKQSESHCSTTVHFSFNSLVTLAACVKMAAVFDVFFCFVLKFCGGCRCCHCSKRTLILMLQLLLHGTSEKRGAQKALSTR